MLLVDVVLTAAARVWQYREKVEREAAAQFRLLSAQLERARAEPAVIGLARRAADDERVHARLCRELIDQLDPDLPSLSPAAAGALGPPTLSVRDRALYSAVAMSCVTETLSAALLLRIHRAARHPLARSIAHRILRDEIDHSKLGWAHLAAEARRRDVSWLGPHVSGMIREARSTDLEPMAAPAPDCSACGVLRRRDVLEVIDTTVDRVLIPGLARFGIVPVTAEAGAVYTRAPCLDEAQRG